ncbi:hypothetical protein TNCV_3760151 [Trichonephila clavipes]|nr:hypothetical protein TNCV_3760151 [Trichonephila clavipes]
MNGRIMTSRSWAHALLTGEIRRSWAIVHPHQWSVNDVGGAASKICGPPMRGGEWHLGDPPVEFKRVDSEWKKKEEEDSLFPFPDHTTLKKIVGGAPLVSINVGTPLRDFDARRIIAENISGTTAFQPQRGFCT